MLDREIENELIPTLKKLGLGSIVFSPLAQGILTNRYLTEIPEDSRDHSSSQFLKEKNVQENIEKVRELNKIAQSRGQTMAEMAIAWLLSDGVVTSVLVGASRLSQLQDNVKAIDHISFSEDECIKNEQILNN